MTLRYREATSFAPIADTLRKEIVSYYERRGKPLRGEAATNTLDTNSSLAERRGQLLVEMVLDRLGLDSLAGLQLADLGCGFGALAVLFAARGAEVTALDRNRSRLGVGRAVAARHDLRVKFLDGTMQDLPLASGQFDVAIQNNSLCYLVARAERLRALRETRRVLRPGGVLAMRNPSRWTPLDQFTRLPLLQLLPPAAATRVASALGRPRSLVRATSPPEARRELRSAGFVGVVHHPGRRRPAALKLVAPYDHLSAERPRADRG